MPRANKHVVDSNFRTPLYLATANGSVSLAQGYNTIPFPTVEFNRGFQVYGAYNSVFIVPRTGHYRIHFHASLVYTLPAGTIEDLILLLQTGSTPYKSNTVTLQNQTAGSLTYAATDWTPLDLDLTLYLHQAEHIALQIYKVSNNGPFTLAYDPFFEPYSVQDRPRLEINMVR